MYAAATPEAFCLQREAGRDGGGRRDRCREADPWEIIYFNNSQTERKQKANTLDVKSVLLIGNPNQTIYNKHIRRGKS